jgi:hypothetical protein
LDGDHLGLGVPLLLLCALGNQFSAKKPHKNGAILKECGESIFKCDCPGWRGLTRLVDIQLGVILGDGNAGSLCLLSQALQFISGMMRELDGTVEALRHRFTIGKRHVENIDSQAVVDI